MSMDLVSALEEDHKKLKKLIKEGLKEKTSLEDKHALFGDLIQLVTAHAKSEEAVLYAQTCNMDDTRKNAFEGFEEHGLVELLMEEMKSEENDDRWSAKFTVVCELLDHHVEEEEEEYFPKLKHLFSEKERIEMGKEYREMFLRLMEVQQSIMAPQEAHLRSH